MKITNLFLTIFSVVGFTLAGCHALEVAEGLEISEAALAARAGEAAAESTAVATEGVAVREGGELAGTIARARQEEYDLVVGWSEEAVRRSPNGVSQGANEFMQRTFTRLGEHAETNARWQAALEQAQGVAADFSQTARYGMAEAAGIGLGVGGAAAAGGTVYLYEHAEARKKAQCSVAIKKAADTVDQDEKARAIVNAQVVCKDL